MREVSFIGKCGDDLVAAAGKGGCDARLCREMRRRLAGGYHHGWVNANEKGPEKMKAEDGGQRANGHGVRIGFRLHRSRHVSFLDVHTVYIQVVK